MGSKRQVMRLAPSGIVHDLPADQVGPEQFNDGSNIVFRDGIPTRVGGYARVLNTPPQTPKWAQNINSDLFNYWLYTTYAKVMVNDGTSTDADITPLTYTNLNSAFNIWTGGVLNGLPVFNQPTEAPMWWDLQVGNKAQYLPGWPVGTRCQALRPFKYHLIAMNISDAGGDFGDGVMWSAAAEPGAIPLTWAAAPGNEAGDNQLSDSPGDLVDGRTLRDAFILYKNQSTYAMQYVGGNQVFAFRRILSQSGMLAKNCCASFQNHHVVLTDSDVILFDGNVGTSIIDKKNRKWLFSQIDPTAFRTSYVVTNENDSEVWVVFPEIGNSTPNIALVWSKDSNDWGVRELPTGSNNVTYITSGIISNSGSVPTWDSTPGSWQSQSKIWNSSNFQTATPSLLMMQAQRFYSVDASNTNDGVNVVSTLTKIGLDLGDQQRRKLVKRIWPRIQAAPGTQIFIRMGANDAPNDPVQWSDPVTFTVGVDTHADSFANGRFIGVEFSSNGIDGWRMSGFDVEFTLAGSF